MKNRRILPLLIFGALLVIVARYALELGNYSAPRTASAAIRANSAPTYEKILQDLEKRITSFQKLAEKRPADWIVRERLAKALLERAGLRGGFADFSEAQKVLDEAFAIAPKGSGPLLVAARLNYSLHRLERTEQLLEAVSNQAAIKSQSQLAILEMRANLAFHRGNYAEALSGYRACELAKPGMCQTELATYYGNTGGYAEAEALLNNAYALAGADDPQAQSWLKLQIGILMMKQGRYEDAMKSLKLADQLLPNWWLVREHIAETFALQGDLGKAIEIYEAVVRDTGLPQYMDALADCYQKQGREDEADKLQKRAERLWEEQLAVFPEAAGGHALDHFLASVGKEKLLLELAERNFNARPGGEARMFRAEANLRVGNTAEALRDIESILAGPFRSAELYDLASRAYAKAGDSARAEVNRRHCLQVNPRFYGENTEGRTIFPRSS